MLSVSCSLAQKKNKSSSTTVIPHQGGGHTYSCRGLAGTRQQSLGALWGSLQEGAQMLACRKALAPSIRSGVLGCWSRSDERLRFMREPSPHSCVATQPTAHSLKFTCSLLSPPTFCGSSRPTHRASCSFSWWGNISGQRGWAQYRDPKVCKYLYAAALMHNSECKYSHRVLIFSCTLHANSFSHTFLLLFKSGVRQ